MPTIVLYAPPYAYNGSYIDSTNDYTITGGPTNFNIASVEACASFCGSYTYMGLEDGNQCYCGNVFVNNGVVVNSQQVSCAGNASEACGGPSDIAVYFGIKHSFSNE
ncbi:hypothetical protein MMC34_004973 [Xylographa carneopallida]|nr:hypothetical protein [Xylographa carneopallida]